MSWVWLGLRSDVPAGAFAATRARTASGVDAGFLVAWPPDDDRPARAAKVDQRAVDVDGPAGWVSFGLLPRGHSLAFDDPAVTGMLRRVLSLAPTRMFSTLSVGDDRFVGTLTGSVGRDERLTNDPCALLAPAQLLEVQVGFIGRTGPLPGPVTQRYGGANPWPWDRFDTSKSPI